MAWIALLQTPVSDGSTVEADMRLIIRIGPLLIGEGGVEIATLNVSEALHCK